MRHHQKLIVRAAVALLALTAQAARADEGFHFTLHGGHFYGPGPVKPDTPLPDGEINGIDFDTAAWRGVARFRAGDGVLSDGKTRINANINAGKLGIGESGAAKTFWLTAVEGGPNQGTETYAFDKDLNFNWQVDLALDPGFPEGIIRVDGFRLTTGWVQVGRSTQSVEGAPGGFDRAGSLRSGDFLVGRVGDFTRSGFLNGVLVASANVPMQSDMLPGAPVANLREFNTDIPVDPVVAAELTLAGVENMRPVIDQLLARGDTPQLIATFADIGDRIDAASLNCEDGFLKADRAGKQRIEEVRWGVDSARKLFFIPWAFLSTYSSPTGKPSESVRDSSRRGFEAVHDVVAMLRSSRVTAGSPL